MDSAECRLNNSESSYIYSKRIRYSEEYCFWKRVLDWYECGHSDGSINRLFVAVVLSAKIHRHTLWYAEIRRRLFNTVIVMFIKNLLLNRNRFCEFLIHIKEF